MLAVGPLGPQYSLLFAGLRCHHKNEIRLRQIYLEVLPIGAILGRYVEEHL